MPAKGQVPPPTPPHLQPRALWEEAFRRELVKLKPHLEGALKPLATMTGAALAQHGLDSDPKAAARQYHAASAKPKR